MCRKAPTYQHVLLLQRGLVALVDIWNEALVFSFIWQALEALGPPVQSIIQPCCVYTSIKFYINVSTCDVAWQL